MIIHCMSPGVLEDAPRYEKHGRETACVLCLNVVKRGFGQKVYSFDLEGKLLSQYEVKSHLLDKEVEVFAVPIDMIRSLGYTENTLKSWDQWTEKTSYLDETEDGEPIQVLCTYWASRGDAATLLPEDGNEFQMILSKDFDVHEDYIVVQRTFVYPRRSRRQLELLAGKAPPWAMYPILWADWVYNEDVRESALRHLKEEANDEDLIEKIDFAEGLSNKDSLVLAWNNVQVEFEARLGTKLGSFPNQSLVAAKALPLRLAGSLGSWEPPFPQPEKVNLSTLPNKVELRAEEAVEVKRSRVH